MCKFSSGVLRQDGTLCPENVLLSSRCTLKNAASKSSLPQEQLGMLLHVHEAVFFSEGFVLVKRKAASTQRLRGDH